LNITKILSFSIGSFGTAIIGLVTIPLVAWHFSSEDVGRIALLQSLLSLSVVLTTLGLDQAYIREVYEEENEIRLIKNCITPSIILIGLILFIVFFTDLVAIVFDYEDTGSTALVISASVLCEYLNRFISVKMRMDGRANLYSLITITPKLVFLVALIAISTYGARNFTGIVYSYFISHVFALLIGLAVYKSVVIDCFFEKTHWRETKRLLKYGFPLFISGLCFWGVTGLDRFMVKELSGLEELAIYSLAFNFSAAGLVLQAVFSVVWAPIVYKWATEDGCERKISMTLRYIMIVVISIHCSTGIFAPFIGHILPAKYELVVPLVVCCISYPLIYILSEISSIGINIKRKTGWNIVITIISVFFNVLVNFALIPSYGAAGASIATSLTFLLYMVMKTEISNMIWYRISMEKNYATIFSVNILAVLVVYFDLEYDYKVQVGWLFVLIVCFIVLTRREDFVRIRYLIRGSNE